MARKCGDMCALDEGLLSRYAPLSGQADRKGKITDTLRYRDRQIEKGK